MIIFFDFFPFDSLSAVPESPGTFIRSVRLSIGLICRGTAVSVILCTIVNVIIGLTLISTTHNEVVPGGKHFSSWNMVYNTSLELRNMREGSKVCLVANG